MTAQSEKSPRTWAPTSTSMLASALIGLLIPSTGSPEDSPPLPRYSIKQDEPLTGTNIRSDIITSSLPLDKRYDQLTAEQQRQIKSLYEQMGDADEPPFPARGLGPTLTTILKVAEKLRVAGTLTMFVEIDSQGNATSVSVLQSPDPQMTKFAATALMLQKYKPAVCDGQPCKMQFPVRIEIATRHIRLDRVFEQ